MKILNIQLNPQICNSKNYQRKFQENIIQQTEYAKLPTTQQYLAFTGGYSLDLAKTVKQLDILAEKNPSIYPPNIREWLGLILEEGNKAKETLISVHKKYFASLKDCFTLNEVKAKFPEFQHVKSSNYVSTSNGSFLNKFQKGELEYFDNDEDLAVQLIKLYWGEGFSLNDLKRYACGKDLYYTMTQQLNIPTVSRDYGHILKFSDETYNERLIKEMTERRLATLDRKAQLQDGEPVYIKRGPLSSEHKQHISEGLKKHWMEHPEKIYLMSERQKNFYRENPEKAEIFERVLKKAWNIFGADKIKKAMSKFFKDKKLPIFDVEGNPSTLTKEQSKAMSKFWADNEWAKKSFAKNMKYSWKKVLEENERLYEIDLTPEGFKQKFYTWAEKKGLNTDNLDFKFKISKYKPELNGGNGVELSKYTPKFIDEYFDKTGSNQSTVMANTYLLALMNISKELKTIKHSHISEQTNFHIDILRTLIRESLFEPQLNLTKAFAKRNIPNCDIDLMREIRIFETPEAQEIYRTALMYCLQFKNSDLFIKIFDKHLNKAYNQIDKQKNIHVMITREMLVGVLK